MQTRKFFRNFGILGSSLLMAGLVFGSLTTVRAQSAPTSSPPIQRIIEAEGEQSFSGPLGTAAGSAQKTGRSVKAPLYGLAAIVLILIAAGAIYYIWTQEPRSAQ